jgi:Acetyltransferase (GNAT) domain
MEPHYRTGLVTTRQELQALRSDWLELFHRSQAPNPFAHPDWLLAWSEHFVASDGLYVVTVRAKEGMLVGIAPFYRRLYQFGLGPKVTHLQLLGTGRQGSLTEIPAVLTQPGQGRKILRAVMQALSSRSCEWDWFEVTMTPEQGWLEPEWLPYLNSSGNYSILHKDTRPFVVVPLPSTIEEFRSGLKRNVKESIRRGVNRPGSLGLQWHVAEPHDRMQQEAALQELMRLHQARAELHGKKRHPDLFTQPADRSFLLDVGNRLFDSRHLIPSLLYVNDKPVAGRLLLHANRSTFFSFSGFDPAWWPCNVATTLTAQCLYGAIERGDVVANLSAGPDQSKLRWSERLELHQDFMVVGPRRSSRAAFSIFWQLRAARVLRQERRHRELA